jgi:hypothetical protein
MFLMFALFVVSLCTLLWAAFSVARHIRRDKQHLQPGPLPADPLSPAARPPQQGTPELTGLNPRSGE